MTPEALRALLEEVAAGALTVEDAARRVAHAPYEDLGYARVDHHRALVSGTAEVVYGEGKTPAQIAGVAEALLGRGANVLITRASREAFEAVARVAPDAVHHAAARVISIVRVAPARIGTAALVCAGTSDLPVLEECEVCARAWGIETERFVDVGVAGIHRILAARERIDAHDVVIVVAGMEGALASVAAGLTRKPVIGVPTSVGYGASFGGVAALLAMLNACASGIVVVNIDNGFGAAAAARRLLARAPVAR
jgi:pyridinium-3,5-biscarboxylic acid mononucleotide synthase